MAFKPSLATVADLAEWLGESIDANTPDGKRAATQLAMASSLVRRETGRTWLDDSGAALDDVPDDVALVTLACAARGYTNPRGLTDVSEALDDYNRREQTKVEESGLYLTASEIALLAPFAGVAHQGLTTVTTTRGESGHRDLFGDGERILPPYY